MALMGHKNEDSSAESSQTPESSEQSPENDKSSGKHESPRHPSKIEEKEENEQAVAEEENEGVSVEKTDKCPETAEATDALTSDPDKVESVSPLMPVELPSDSPIKNLESSDSIGNLEKKDVSEVEPLNKLEPTLNNLEPVQVESRDVEVDQVEGPIVVADDLDNDNLHETIYEQKIQVESTDEEKAQAEDPLERASPVQAEASTDSNTADTSEAADFHSFATKEVDGVGESSKSELEDDSAGESSKTQSPSALPLDEASEVVSDIVSNENYAIAKAIEVDQHVHDSETDIKEQGLSSGTNASDTSDSFHELEKVKTEMKMMENALLGAARQAQVCGEMIFGSSYLRMSVCFLHPLKFTFQFVSSPTCFGFLVLFQLLCASSGDVLFSYSYDPSLDLTFFQAKADEIAKLMNENEQLKSVIEDLKVCRIFALRYTLI